MVQGRARKRQDGDDMGELQECSRNGVSEAGGWLGGKAVPLLSAGNTLFPKLTRENMSVGHDITQRIILFFFFFFFFFLHHT